MGRRGLVSGCHLGSKQYVFTANATSVGNTGSIPRLGFQGFCTQDSPLGIRFADYVSAFPAGGTIAASWDRGEFYRRGYQMGVEHRGKGVDIQLGPVVGPIGRNPKGGRNWEGFGADPYLAGEAAYETILGMQQGGVQACAKHFVNKYAIYCE